MGIIFQDFTKYELTCRENIGLGNINLMDNDVKLQAAINKAYANETVDALPKGIDTQCASLDPVSEYEIFQRVSELTKGKISIFISHRLYNLRKISSRILVLKDGQLTEQGTHEELMDLNGHYGYLYRLQNNIEFVPNSDI